MKIINKNNVTQGLYGMSDIFKPKKKDALVATKQ